VSLPDLRRLRLDDLTPPHRMPTLEANWERLLEDGWIAWPFPPARWREAAWGSPTSR
jgi:hypothetical protein